MSLVTNEKLNYFAQGLYGKIKTNFDAKGSADTAEANAKTYADGLNTTMNGRVTALETTVGNAESGLVKDIAVLKGDKSVEGSVQFQVAQIVAGADANYDTLKEIADWIMSDQTGAAKMANDIKANADAITDLETLVGTIPAEATATDIVGYIAEYVQAQLTASDLSQYAKATDFNALKDVVGDGTKGLVKGLADVTTKATDNETAIGVLNGTDTVAGSVAKALKDAKDYTDTKDLAMSTRVDDIEAGMKPYVKSVKEEYREDFNFISNLPYGFCDMNFSDGLDLSGCSLMFNNELHIIGSSINENSNKHYKYNFDSKEWTSVSTLPLSTESAGFNPVMKDTIIEYKNEMYWFIGNTYYKFNNTTQEWEEVNNSTFNFDGIYPLPLVYRDELYVLLITSSNGGTKSLKKYNDTDKTWSTVVSFDNNFASYDYTMAKVFNDEIHILGLSSSDNVIHYKYDGSTLIEVNNNLSKDCINRFYASLQVYNNKLYLYDFSGYYEYNGSAWNDKIQYTNLLKDTVVYNNSLYAIGFVDNVTTENIGFSNKLYKLEKINNTITNKLSDTNTDDEVPTAKLVYESITDAVAQAKTYADGLNTTMDGRMTAVETKANANETAIATLNGADTVEGSVAKALKDGVAEAKTYADGLAVDAVAQSDFDTLDNQVNGVQATITLKENGTVTAEAATYTYNENDKFFINDLTEPVSQTYNQYQYGMENASRYVVITGKDGVVKRLTDAEGRLTTTETGIETNAKAITQLRADVDANIASLEDVHIDATAENKYDNTTGNINLYLNDGKVYEEIDYYYNGSDWYKLGSNATYSSGSYATINKETNTINHDVTVTEENFADMVATGLWRYGSPLENYPNVKTIKVVDSNGNVDYYNSKETSYRELVQEFEVRPDRETCTLYLLIKDESTKIEVPVTELKTAIEKIATNSAAIGVESDSASSVPATGIYARLESLESVMGTASVKDGNGNVVTPATGVQKQIEDLQASQNEVITEAQIDEIINGLV